MIEEEVRRLADAAAIEACRDLEHYELGENRHHEDGSWSVLYLGKVALVGQLFLGPPEAWRRGPRRRRALRHR